MATNPVQPVGGEASALNQAQFMKLLLAQLTHQDPLAPADNNQFVAQMAQFSALAQAQSTNTNIQALLVTQQASQAIGLIGKTVLVTMPNGTQKIGAVLRITFDGGEPRLTMRDGISSSGPEVPDIALGQVAGVNPP
ncbi:flagellar hook assembly protein FlgD [Massilia endophytica]|uniref:flagellar hook assembly protein FlgD n=1 Tax=Massilia endophytica TaxID=2899220 RepID=UPI001E3AC176|nr:flagellar hook capping FlgD N-terminal domain-containing protein [Massilia endophytica]UGQ47973.1 flagellar hook capping protein [Massilia endophytica]